MCSAMALPHGAQRFDDGFSPVRPALVGATNSVVAAGLAGAGGGAAAGAGAATFGASFGKLAEAAFWLMNVFEILFGDAATGTRSRNFAQVD